VVNLNQLTATTGDPLLRGIVLLLEDDVDEPNDTSPLVHTCFMHTFPNVAIIHTTFLIFALVRCFI